MMPKPGLPELTEQLGSARQASKSTGYSRVSFHRSRKLREKVMTDLSRNRPILKDLLPEHVNQATMELAFENPSRGQEPIRNTPWQ